MAYTAADLARIESAIALGATRVRHSDGRDVTYRSTAEMMRLRDMIRAELGQGGTRRKKYLVYDKGLSGSVDTADQ